VTPHLKSAPETAVCNSDRNGRILNCDQYGRTSTFCFRVLPFRRSPGVRQVSVLSELKVGQTGILIALDLPESVQNHLMHMGFVPEARVTALRRAPAGDPTVYAVDGIEIALRHETAEGIRVRSEQALTEAPAQAKAENTTSLVVPELIEIAR
jgi:ferrous iron transport protein A